MLVGGSTGIKLPMSQLFVLPISCLLFSSTFVNIFFLSYIPIIKVDNIIIIIVSVIIITTSTLLALVKKKNEN